MKELRRDLQAVVKSLKVLTRKTERMAKKLDKLEKRWGAKKVKAKGPARGTKKRVAKKTKKLTATDSVLKIIQRRKRGVTTAEIKAMTGYKEKKIWDIVNRARSEGKVKSLRKGVYAKA